MGSVWIPAIDNCQNYLCFSLKKLTIDFYNLTCRTYPTVFLPCSGSIFPIFSYFILRGSIILFDLLRFGGVSKF